MLNKHSLFCKPCAVRSGRGNNSKDVNKLSKLEQIKIVSNIIFFILITVVGAGCGAILSDMCNLPIFNSIMGGILVMWILDILNPRL